MRLERAQEEANGDLRVVSARGAGGERLVEGLLRDAMEDEISASLERGYCFDDEDGSVVVGAAAIVQRVIAKYADAEDDPDERDEDDRTGGAGGPPVSLTWSLDGDDVELATVVVEDADVVSASSPLSQNSMRMMARQTSPNIPATMAYTRADWTVP